MKAMIVMIAAFLAAAYAIRHGRQQPERQPDRRQRDDLEGIAPHIERAAELLDQLRELDDLHTSLELCAPRERAQALQLEWTNHNGSRHAARIWMDGHSSTASVMAAATQEREMLCTSLLEEIRAAYSAECVTETGRGLAFRTVTESDTKRGVLNA